MCCFCTSTVFFPSGCGSFVVLSALEHPGRPPVHHGASLGPGRGSIRVTCSGDSKSRENWQVTTGGHSEHVKPYRRIKTHVRGENNVRRVSHGVLLTSSTDCLATSCTCSSACARARVRLVLVLLCSFSSARVLVCAGVLEWSCSCSNCSSVGVCSSARVLVLVIECSSVGECSSARS